MKIDKAVIPAAGWGTRLAPLTKSTPKEMLPVLGKPMIEHAVQEAVAAGIEEICVVIRKGKEIIIDHLEAFIANDKSGSDYCLNFVFQEKPLGLGDALHTAKPLIGGFPFVMIIPDQMLFSSAPVNKLVENYNFEDPAVLSSMVRIPASEVAYFPGARGFVFEKSEESETFPIDSLLDEGEAHHVIEKDGTRLRAFGRTVFPPEIFEYLTMEYINPVTGEVDLMKTFEAFTGRFAHYGLLLEGIPCDFGTIKGYRFYNDKLSALKKEGLL